MNVFISSSAERTGAGGTLSRLSIASPFSQSAQPRSAEGGRTAGRSFGMESCASADAAQRLALAAATFTESKTALFISRAGRARFS